MIPLKFRGNPLKLRGKCERNFGRKKMTHISVLKRRLTVMEPELEHFLDKCGLYEYKESFKVGKYCGL